MAVTRLGLYGGARSPYGSFVKAAPVAATPDVSSGSMMFFEMAKSKRKKS